MEREDIYAYLWGMNYTIKNLRFHPGHDAEGFSCDLYENGKKLCQVIDDSWGGEYMLKLSDGSNYIPKDRGALECAVGDLVHQEEEKRQQKKMTKKGIVFRDKVGLGVLEFDVQIPTLLKKYSNGLEALQKAYNKAVADGKEIVNVSYLASVGVAV